MSKIRDLPEGFEWKIEWRYDEDGDISWLGTFMREDDGSDYIIDTSEGRLLGPYEDSYQQFVWALAVEDFPDEVTRDGRNWLLLDAEEGEEGWYHFEGRPIIREDLPHYPDRYSYRNAWWSTDRHENYADQIAQYGFDEVMGWVVGDYERHIAWCNDEWTFEGCIVRLCHEDNPDTLADASLWGIESDRDQTYTNEVEEDLMHECLSEFEGHIDDFIYSRIVVDKEDPQGSLAEVLKVRVEKMAELQKWLDEVEAERIAAYEAQRAKWEGQKKDVQE